MDDFNSVLNNYESLNNNNPDDAALKNNELNNLTPLVEKVMSDLNRAVTAKYPIMNRIIAALYSMQNEYTPEKLREIRTDAGGSELFIPLINMKVRAGKAWLSDIYADEDTLFELKPTPIPDVPDQIEQQLQQQLMQTLQPLLQSGATIDPQTQQVIQEQTKDDLMNMVKDRADKLAQKMQQQIYDQFIQGGFYKAFSSVLYDLVLFPAGILKGPVLRREQVFMKNSKEPTSTIIPTYNRVNPIDLYPSPTSTDIDSDYIVEILHLAPADLYNLIGVEGFNEDAIRSVLSRYTGGYLAVTVGGVDSAVQELRQQFEGKNYFQGDVIDVIEYWGTIRGSVLQEEGIADTLGVPIDDVGYYNMCIWVADSTVIKAMLNPDPLGHKPYTKTSFVEIPDSFWGLSIADILKPLQEALNALARSAINNSIISSGPIIERNVDRINVSEQKQVFPFMMIDAHESAMNSAPAVRMYNVPPTVQQLIEMMQTIYKFAEDLSGIPSYESGTLTQASLGRTASGLSMLHTNASRGIKDVVNNIDTNLIEPIVKKQYYFNLQYLTDIEDVPDYEINAQGVSILDEKASQVQRALEFLQITSNPMDTQLLGVEGRRYLLEQISNNLGLDTDKIFAASPELQQFLQQLQQQQGQAPVPNQGQPPQGQVPFTNQGNGNPVIDKAQDLGQNVNQFSSENGR
jgi:hypothetical protein